MLYFDAERSTRRLVKVGELFVTYEHLQKHVSCILQNLKHSVIINVMEKADQGIHFLLLHNPGFPEDITYKNSI